jgi:hypothetical protein
LTPASCVHAGLAARPSATTQSDAIRTVIENPCYWSTDGPGLPVPVGLFSNNGSTRDFVDHSQMIDSFPRCTGNAPTHPAVHEVRPGQATQASPSRRIVLRNRSALNKLDS